MGCSCFRSADETFSLLPITCLSSAGIYGEEGGGEEGTREASSHPLDGKRHKNTASLYDGRRIRARGVKIVRSAAFIASLTILNVGNAAALYNVSLSNKKKKKEERKMKRPTAGGKIEEHFDRASGSFAGFEKPTERRFSWRVRRALAANEWSSQSG